MFDSLWLHGLQPARFLCPWNFPGKNTGVGCYFLLKEIFPTQGSNSHLLHLLLWQVDSLPLSHLGRQSLLWVAYNWMLFFFKSVQPIHIFWLGSLNHLHLKKLLIWKNSLLPFSFSICFVTFLSLSYCFPLLSLSDFLAIICLDSLLIAPCVYSIYFFYCNYIKHLKL